MEEKKAGQSKDVAIDSKAWVYYKDGLTKFYLKFANISKLKSGKRIILKELSIEPSTNGGCDVLSQLLRCVSEKYKIKRVFVDQYFFTSDSFKVFQKHPIEYLMPCPCNQRIKSILEICPVPCVIKDFQLQDVFFDLIIINHKDNEGQYIKKAFATNININVTDPNAIKKLFSHNSIHWEINVAFESVNNSKKHPGA